MKNDNHNFLNLAEESSNARKVLTGLLVAVCIGLFFVIGYLSLKISYPEKFATKEAENEEDSKPAYKYAFLEEDCSDAARTLRQHANKRSKDAEEAYLALQRDINTAISSYYQDIDNSVSGLDPMYDDVTQLYLNGDITREDYDERIANFDSVKARLSIPDQTYLRKIEDIDDKADDLIDEERDNIKAIRQDAEELDLCSKTASRKGDFSDHELSKIEGLIEEASSI